MGGQGILIFLLKAKDNSMILEYNQIPLEQILQDHSTSFVRMELHIIYKDILGEC